MFEIVMPRLGVNDDYVTLISWTVKEGDWVDVGDIIAEIETSKETSELRTGQAGIISFSVNAGDEVEVGEVVATIGEGERPEKHEEEVTLELHMTEKAKKIIEENKIDISKLPKDRLIKEKDVLALVSVPYVLSGTKNNDIVLYGGGGFSRIAIDILKVTHAYNVHGVVDMKYPEIQDVMGVPVIGGDEQLQEIYDEGYRKIFNGVGVINGQYGHKLPYEKLKKYGFEFPNVIHKTAILEPSTVLGEGVLVCAGAIIGAMAQIGNNCVINAGSIISHDCIVSDNCHIASGAVLAGIVTVGENTLIGQNVSIYSRVKIGSNVVIENGCSIFKDVPDNTIVRNKAR